MMLGAMCRTCLSLQEIAMFASNSHECFTNREVDQYKSSNDDLQFELKWSF